MKQAIGKSLRDSVAMRWTVLGLVAFTMMTGYFFTDVLSPLKQMLEVQHGWDGETYGFFTGAYAFLNVTFLMLIFGGIILDKMGVRFTSITSGIVMIIGASLNYYALTDTFINGGPLFGLFDSFLRDYPVSVKCSFVGYAIFGMGVEMAGITVSKIIVKWFKGKELALAMGIEMAVARLGMFSAFAFAEPISRIKEEADITLPVGFGVLLLVIGLLTFLIYYGMDIKLDKEEEASKGEESSEEQFRISDVLKLFTNKGFILISILCVLFYSAVFPFMKFAVDLMHHKYSMTIATAGFVAGLLPFGNMLLTPVFGTVYDRKGKGASIMILGSILLIIVHSIYAFAPDSVVFAYVAIFVLGVGFSLVPSAMWPSVPKIVDERYLGSAYSVIFFIQNLGLMGVPYLTGVVLKNSNPGVAELIQQGDATARYDYFYPSLIFVACGVLAFFVAIMLKAEDKKKGFGLELPNIQK